MIRTISWLLTLAALAVGLALLALYNEGYVLLVVPPWRIELSLNLFVLLALGGFAFLYLLLRAIVHTLRLPGSVRAYRARRAHDKAETALRDALAQWLAGRYTQSLRSAELAFKAGHAPGIATLLAWRSAHALGDKERSAEWQTRADALGPEHQLARLMTEAELALDQRRYADALNALNTLMAAHGRHFAAMRLSLRAHLGLGQWNEVLHIIHQLEKHHALGPEQAEAFKLAVQRELELKPPELKP